MRRHFITLLLLIQSLGSGRGTLWAQSPPALAEGLALYRQNRLQDAVKVFAAVAHEDSLNAEAWAWLAETTRRLGEPEYSEHFARRALALDSCQSFAHTVLGDLYNRQLSTWSGVNADSAWAHIHRALDCNPADGNAWLSLWAQSMWHDDPDGERLALRRLVETGFLTHSALALNRWILQALPARAVLITNGDLDTYPALALQVTESLRPDVAVVNASLLNMPRYVALVRERHGLPVPFDSSTLTGTALRSLADSIVGYWHRAVAAHRLGRPLCIGVMTADWARKGAGFARDAGAYWEIRPDSVPPDTAAMRQAMGRADWHDFVGVGASPTDRSPVRWMSGQTGARVVLIVVSNYAERLQAAGETNAIRPVLDWLEEFVRGTSLQDDTGKWVLDWVAETRKKLGS